MNSIYVSDIDKELLGAVTSRGKTNIIVSDSAYRIYSYEISYVYRNMAHAVRYYQADLRRVAEKQLLSGQTHEALLAYISLFDGIADRIEQIGDTHSSYCLAFIDEIDDIDKEIYEPGCDPRDFTSERMSYFCRMVRDASDNLIEGLGNWIGNGFAWLKEKICQTFGGKLGIDLNMEAVRASILASADYEEEDIRRIHKAIKAADGEFGQKFADLYHEFETILVIIAKANEIVSNVSRFNCQEIATIQNELNNIHISEVHQEERFLTQETAAEYCANEENKAFFDEYNTQLEELRDDMGVDEALLVATTTATSQAFAELFKSYKLPDGVSGSEAYEYFLIKKDLAELVEKVSDNEVDWEKWMAENPEIAGWYQNKMASDNVFSRAIRELFKDKIDLGISDDSLKALAATYWKYEKNLEVIGSLAAGMDPNSLTAIAVRELQWEYQNYGQNEFERVLQSLIDEQAKSGVKGLNKVIVKLMGDLGEKISLGVYATQKVAEVTGITEIGNDLAKFDCLQRQNEDLLAAYKYNFDAIADGEYTQAEVDKLNHSFTLLKSHYAKQYECLERVAGQKGDHKLKRYYDYMGTQIKKANITNLENTVSLSYKEYCAMYE